MTVGLATAPLAGVWPAAVLIVFFMRLADSIEHFTVTHAREAVRDLTAMAPEMARVERDGVEHEVAEVRIGEIVIVRPGEKVPVDGEVIGGQATVDQAATTGKSMPVEAGMDTAFGHAIKRVEEYDQHRPAVQCVADRFATWYLPVMAAVAAATLIASIGASARPADQGRQIPRDARQGRLGIAR